MAQDAIVIHSINDVKRSGNDTSLAQILASKGLLTFDGVYVSVWDNREALRERLKGAILFPMFYYIGMDNSFDTPTPLERFCTIDQLITLRNDFGCIIGSHTWRHPDLRTCNDIQMMAELFAPSEYKVAFAYPYSAFNDRVIEAVKKAGYEEAFCAGPFGDGSQFQRKRRYL